ncbi:helix-turn-helix transcriptional regulator [Acidobacteria bacterium AH-259-D05]|nr:helix-turn-helix transcriptional regulator [Acidobacteria bacterium AH-259-D05]
MLNARSSASRRLLELLKETGRGIAIKELCEELQLSSMAVRRQLTLLEGDGLIFSENERKKVGRPAKRYYLTDQGHEYFERDYANLTIELLVALRSLNGKRKVDQVFQMSMHENLKTARKRVLGKTLEARVHDVTKLLAEKGYMAKWEKIGPDKYLIKLMNCAVLQVAKTFPRICVCEEDFLSELLQTKVTRRHYILKNGHFCSYLVEG